MSRQLQAANSLSGRRGFSSSSDICWPNRGRMIVASLSQSGGRGGLGGCSTRSLSSMGGSRRIPCVGGHQTGGFGSLGGRHAFPYLHQSFGGDMHYGIPRSCTELRNYGGSCWHGRVLGVSVNELLLKPLCVGVDPELQNIRIREREQMKSLNNQFARFIDQVRCLEQKNKVLVTKWRFLQQQARPVRRDLKPLFENAISSLSKQLGFLLREKEQMEAQLGHMLQSVEETKCEYEEEINQRMAMENDFVLLKRDVDGAFMNKVHLETKVESMKQEAAFLRCVHDEEIALLKEQIQSETTITVQMDNTRDLDMDAIIHGVESWYQSIAHRSKEEASAFYQNTWQELRTQKSQMSEALKMSKREMAEAGRAVQRLQYEAGKGKKQVACLQSALCDAEKRGDCALKDAQERLVELNGALHETKDQLAVLLWSSRELLNHKLALDSEIAMYKSLLEGEENRLLPDRPQNAVVLPVSSTAVVHYGLEPGHSSLRRKSSLGCPPKRQNPGDADWPHMSRNISSPVSKQCITGSEGVADHSSSACGYAPRGLQKPTCVAGGCTASVVRRCAGSHCGARCSAAVCCCHGHSCKHGMKMSTAPCFSQSNRK